MAEQGEDLPEAAVDPSTKDVIGWIGKALYYISYPIFVGIYYIVYYVSFAVVFVVKLLYRPLEFILLPIVYLVQFVLNCLAAPFRFLARFETLYIYLGIAALIGISGGLILNLIYGSLNSFLGLDAETEKTERTAKQYRKDKRKQKAKAEAPLISSGQFAPGYPSLPDGVRKPNRNKSLVAQTIMEEMDSD